MFAKAGPMGASEGEGIYREEEKVSLIGGEIHWCIGGVVSVSLRGESRLGRLGILAVNAVSPPPFSRPLRTPGRQA